MSQVATLMEHFDATQFDPTQRDGGGFPVGKHPVQIVESEIAPTKDNSGSMLVLSCEITDGPHKGMVGKYRLNLYNNNPDAARIARNQLSALCHVIGVYNIGNSVGPLHNKPFMIEVGLQKGAEAAEKGYTEIKKVFDTNGNEPGKAGNGAAPQQPQAQPGFGNNGQNAQPQNNGGGQPQGQWNQAAQNNAPANNGGGQWNQPQGGAQPQGQTNAGQGGWNAGNNGGGQGGAPWNAPRQ